MMPAIGRPMVKKVSQGKINAINKRILTVLSYSDCASVLHVLLSQHNGDISGAQHGKRILGRIWGRKIVFKFWNIDRYLCR